MKIESRRHEAEPDRAKPGEMSTPPAAFEHLPAEIFFTSVVFAFQHGFCRVKAQHHGSQKIIFGFPQRFCRIFPAGLTLVGGASRKSRPGGKSGLMEKFFRFRRSGPRTNIFRCLADIWGYALYVFPQEKKKKCTPARRKKNRVRASSFSGADLSRSDWGGQRPNAGRQSRAPKK